MSIDYYNNIQNSVGSDYNSPPKIFKNNQNKIKNNLLSADTLSLSKSNKNKTDYSADDGKISFKDKLKNFAKGIVSPITAMFSSPKNFAIGAVSLVGVSLLIAATGGAIAPVLAAGGITMGGIQIGRSAYNAATAKTDDEARQAWQGIGSGTTAVVSSVTGAKGALKASGVDTFEMSYSKAVLQCFKEAPKSLKTTVSQFKLHQLPANIKQTFNSKSKAVETEHPKQIKPDITGKNVQEATIQTGSTIDLKKSRYDKTGVVEILENNSDHSPKGTPINEYLDDEGFLQKIKSLGSVTDDGKLNINLSDGRKVSCNCLVEEINGQKVMHLYTSDGDFLTDIYNGGIISRRNFTQYLDTRDGKIVFGRKFNPKSTTTKGLEAFYKKQMENLLTQNKEISLQNALDIFPDASKIEVTNGTLTIGETNYSISDNCELSFLDLDGAKWKIRVHSQGISSRNKNWIFRVGYNTGKETKYFDISTSEFNGIAKGVGSQSSHIPIESFYQGEQQLLNDGNFVSCISYLSSKLNSNDNFYSGQIAARIRNFAINVGIKNPKGYGKNSETAIINEIMKRCNFNTPEEAYSAIFNS